jgi:L-aminopeptidase/D-esterase-like protein
MALGVSGLSVGCWTDAGGGTGTTALVSPAGTLGGVAVRGGAPGTREVAALGATGTVTECHAVVLSGGSAFGLAAADGAVAWCEANGLGYDHGVARIPIVGGAIVFDLRRAGAPRPGFEAGWAACEAAAETDPPMGSVGVGAGCSVGKLAGPEWGSKGGQGCAVAHGDGVTVGALVAVNALGDVVDEAGSVLAGSRAPEDHPRFPDATHPAPAAGEHTVVGCLATDAALSKPDAVRAADLAHSGIARAVSPAHTSFDGDALFLLAAQRVTAGLDLVAHLSAQAVAAAVRAGVRHATDGAGFPADPRAG